MYQVPGIGLLGRVFNARFVGFILRFHYTGLFLGRFEFCSLYEKSGFISFGRESPIHVVFEVEVNKTGAAAGGLWPSPQYSLVGRSIDVRYIYSISLNILIPYFACTIDENQYLRGLHRHRHLVCSIRRIEPKLRERPGSSKFIAFFASYKEGSQNCYTLFQDLQSLGLHRIYSWLSWTIASRLSLVPVLNLQNTSNIEIHIIYDIVNVCFMQRMFWFNCLFVDAKVLFWKILFTKSWLRSSCLQSSYLRSFCLRSSCLRSSFLRSSHINYLTSSTSTLRLSPVSGSKLREILSGTCFFYS